MTHAILDVLGLSERNPGQFRQDVGDFRRCTIFDTAGNKRAAEYSPTGPT